MAAAGLKRFLLPRRSRGFSLRLLLVAVAAFVLFQYVFIPFRIHGHSMWPTYRDGSFNFCFTLRYLFSEPDRFDVVNIEMAGRRVMLLKRIVALENETVAFQEGGLYVNGEPLEEPYLVGAYDWNLPPRRVEQGHVYVVGDNRGIPQERHDFGQTPLERVVGAPLW